MQIPSSSTLKSIGVALLAGALFTLGWCGHKWFSKPIVKEVIKTITVTVGPPDQQPHEAIVDHGIVNPGTHFGNQADQPKPPTDTSIPELPHPNMTTTIKVFVPTPMKLQIFHQTELNWALNGDNYNIWNDSRVWTRDEQGNALPGITADTLYNKESTLSLPIKMLNICPKERPWAAGGSLHFNPKGYGMWLDRDLAMFRVSGEVVYTPPQFLVPSNVSGSLRAGIRF